MQSGKAQLFYYSCEIGSKIFKNSYTFKSGVISTLQSLKSKGCNNFSNLVY